MPLDFADFAHHYEGQNLTEAQSRAHFDTLADVLDCIVRLFWSDGARAKELGITLDSDTLAGGEAVDSRHPLTTSFNDAAPFDGAGRQEI